MADTTTAASAIDAPATPAALTIIAEETLGTVSPLQHGHFAEHLGHCVYDGLWVGLDSSIPNEAGWRKDILDAFRKIGIPALRWPGGCFADSYHWRDGIGRPDQRPQTFAESCGERVVDTNAVGTHEFIDLCRRIGAEPYLAGNVGSGTVQELADWVHYCNSDLDTTLARQRQENGQAESMNVRWWGVGNENWGCGGNFDAESYAKEFRRYATFLRQVDGPRQELVACGDNKRSWNLPLIETLAKSGHLHLMDHLSVHQYWGAGTAQGFSLDDYYRIMSGPDQCEDVINHSDEILRFFSPQGKRRVMIAFDEWGVWHPEANTKAAYEAPSTLRDAVSAAGTLDVFHRHADKVSMANIAQIVNVLQALAQTRGDKMWLTPTYHAFDLYKEHRGAAALRSLFTEAPTVTLPGVRRNFPESTLPETKISLVSASASRLANGGLVLSLSNRHASEPLEVTINLRGGDIPTGPSSRRTLTGDAPNAVNGPDQPDQVTVTESTGPAAAAVLTLTLPPCSVETLIWGA